MLTEIRLGCPPVSAPRARGGITAVEIAGQELAAKKVVRQKRALAALHAAAIPQSPQARAALAELDKLAEADRLAFLDRMDSE